MLELNESFDDFKKLSPLDKHFGRRCIVEDNQHILLDFEEDRGEMPKLCVHCKHRGKGFIVNDYMHFHCNHPDEKIAGEPGWGSLRDITSHDYKCWEG